MKKRIVSCLMALAFVTGGFPGTAWAGEGALCPHHTVHTEACRADGACDLVCGVCQVEAAIDGLPDAENASEADHEAVQEAWDAWEELSPEEQAQVRDHAKLEALPASYNELTTPLQEETVELYLENGDIIFDIDYNTYTQGSISGEMAGDFIITQGNKAAPSTNGIYIISDAGGAINITLKDIYIDTSGLGAVAVHVSGSKAVFILEGENQVVSGAGHAGIMLEGDSEFTIRGGGSLTVKGGNGGAGIGAVPGSEEGSIHIESGAIFAYGGEGAVGIDSGAGALTSGENGRAVLHVSGPDQIGNWDTVQNTWNGIVWEGDAGTVYGSVDLTEGGLTIEAGQTLTVPGSSDPASEPALTVTEEGFRNDGTITGTGLVMMDGEKYRIEDNRLVSLTPEPPEIRVSITGDPSKTYDGSPAVLPETGYTVTGSDAAAAVFYKAKSAPASGYAADAPVNAGEYTVKVVCGGAEAEKDFTISQAAPAEAVIPVSVSYDGGAEQTVDLSAAMAPYLLAGDAPVCTVGAFPESGCLAADAVKASGNALSFVLTPGVEPSGGEAVIDIPVTVAGFTNYTPLALTVRITVTFPTPPERPDPPHWDKPSGDDNRPNTGGTSPEASDEGPEPSAAVPDKVTATERPDGTQVIEIERADGTSSMTVVSTSGQTVTTVEISESAAAESGVISLPMPAVPSVRDAAQAPSVTVSGPEGAVVKVEIPVENTAPGTVAVAVGPDGARQVLRQTAPSENGVVITVPTGTTVQILDNAKAFADVPPEHWAGDAVDFVTSRELFSGTDADAFSPDREMTRGMLMTVLARLDGVDTSGGQNWYEKGLEWAVAQGVSSGEAPEGSVTCEQVVTMLYRYAGSPPAAGSLSGFPTDAFSVSDYAVSAVSWALEAGMLTGADGDLMDPRSAATRAEAAILLMRFVERTHGSGAPL